MEDRQIVTLYWNRKENAIVETAAKYGIGSDRATNYHSDSAGTKLNYDAMDKAICAVRSNAPLSSDWKRDIERDFKKRSKK